MQNQNHKSHSKLVKHVQKIAPVKKYVFVCMLVCICVASRHGWISPLEGPGVRMNC